MLLYDDPDMYYCILEEICSNYPSDETLNLMEAQISCQNQKD